MAAAATTAAVLAGAAMLIWPALLNRYPVLFPDTGAFLAQTLRALMIWDKPYVYGPFLHLFHWRVTLWGPVLAQGVILSHLLWLTQRALRGDAGAGSVALWHLGLTAGLAALTTAPWSAALLMPDIFAPVTVLGLVLLGLGRARLSRGEAWYLAALGTVAIAAHLTHLVVAAAVVAVTPLLAPRRQRWAALGRAAAPLGAALALLAATNWVGHGRVAISPYGATFLLARLQEDGPATSVVRAMCPGAGWHLCSFVERLPMEANAFLWYPDSPVNSEPDGTPIFLGGVRIAPEARAILRETIARHPLPVAGAMVRNTLTQFVTTRVGDALDEDHLDISVRAQLQRDFPAREVAAYDAAFQGRAALLDRAAPFLWPHMPALLASLALFGLALWRAARGRCDHHRLALGLLVSVLVGLGANAFATGALSGPYDRYQARIAWLLPFAAVLVLAVPAGCAARRAGGAPIREATHAPAERQTGPAGKGFPFS